MIIMKDYGTVISAVKPNPIKVDEYSVWIHTDIEAFSKEMDGMTFSGWQYRMVQYDKDEYIMHQQEIIEEQITNTQLALCELAENAEV